jgi:hypothetical protein
VFNLDRAWRIWDMDCKFLLHEEGEPDQMYPLRSHSIHLRYGLCRRSQGRARHSHSCHEADVKAPGTQGVSSRHDNSRVRPFEKIALYERGM